MSVKKALTKSAVKFLKIIPEKSAASVIHTINGIRLRSIKRRKVPVSLIFFVTNRCNASCNHCFYWKETAREKEELSTDNIKKILSGLHGLRQVILTGGEPFLRNELAEITGLFTDIGVKVITIPTNGILTDRIIDRVSYIAQSIPVDELKINVSLDGTREVHNSIRNTPGCYDRARETIMRLKELEKIHKNLKVSIITVISNDNISDLEGFIREIEPLNTPLMFTLVRGTDHNTFGMVQDDKMDFNPRKDESALPASSLDRIQNILERTLGKPGSDNWNIFQQLKMDYSINIIKNKKRILNCLAGHYDGVIYNNGDVALCELSRPVGNLTDFDMDFKKLWWSDAADKMRLSRQSCCCIHGCNLLSNMQYDNNTIKEIILNHNYMP